MAWIAPALAYLLLLGALGVTSKYALRSLSWQELVVWAAFAYAVVAALLVATGTPFRSHSGLNGAMAAFSAVVAPVSLALLFIALRSGDASRVIPLTSAYPVVTALLALLILHEGFSVTRVVGTTLVICGVVLVTR